jgi:hypothetical protein
MGNLKPYYNIRYLKRGEKDINHMKGQTGVENLILFALVGLGLAFGTVFLWSSGFFEPYTGRRGQVGFSQIVVVDWIVGSDKAVLSLKNIADNRVIVYPEGVNLTVANRFNCLPPEIEPFYVESSHGFIVELDCPGLDEAFKIGDYYDADLTINYTQMPVVQTRLSVGKLYGHIEDVPYPFIPPTSTTTSTTLGPPRCFYKECHESGEVDEENCGEILFQGSYEECIYCPLHPEVDGKRYCQPKGRCGDFCASNSQCIDPNNPWNRCEMCVNNLCVEDPEPPESQCGQCQVPQPGFGDPKCVDLPQCDYCKYHFEVNTPFNPTGTDHWSCVARGYCNTSCINYDFEVYTECKIPDQIVDNPCPHCNPINITHGVCEPGDCGKPCGPANPMQECELGCQWCNYTAGEPSSFRCELGDCGKPCDIDNPISDCELGCRTCYQVAPGDYRCVKTNIGVRLDAHNGTVGDRVAAVGGDIFLNASAWSSSGVDKLVISNSLNISGNHAVRLGLTGITRLKCKTMQERLHLWFLENGRPDPLDSATRFRLDEEMNITWMGVHECMGARDCRGDNKTSEGAYGVYCYFAMAKKWGSDDWTSLVSDYMQVGFIEVYLISPRPERP